MKTHILRLTSVVKHGVGGPEAGLIDLIYSYLLQKYDLDYYAHIQINQIGLDLDEFILPEKKNIFINIRYPTYEDFEAKKIEEKNFIRLDIVHTALLRLAQKDTRIEMSKLEAIRDEIISKKFAFDFIYKSFPNKKIVDLNANIIIHPEIDRYNFYISIEQGKAIKCKQLIFIGRPTDYYIPAIFYYGKWRKPNLFVISGTDKEVEIRISTDDCKVEFVNLTNFITPPFFEMMKAKINNPNSDKSYIDWLNSLPPAFAAIINQGLN